MGEGRTVERQVELAAEARSARDARRLVASLLDESGHQAWSDAAELAVSEVVTNAVLHAHTRLELTLRLAVDQLVVEVRDFSPRLPVLRHYGDEATTGRGLALVDAVTTAHGVEEHPGGGKVVWFCVGDRSPGDR